MSSELETESGQKVEDRARLAAVEIGEWPGLGGTVGFDVGERITVLVGRNGAGKSLIMEGLSAAAESIVSGINETPIPKLFRCQVERKGVGFSYEFAIEDNGDADDGRVDDDELGDSNLKWSERCKLDGIDEPLWTASNSQILLHGGQRLEFTHDEGLVAIAATELVTIEGMPIEAIQLAKIFEGWNLISAGIPRGAEKRHEILMRRTPRGWRPVVNTPILMNRLAIAILRMKFYDDASYDEFVDLVRQVGVVHNVTIRQYKEQGKDKDSFAAVFFDDVNLGLCSDGTQRIAQIIAQLLSPQTRCLLIEEPETAVHPSLLHRLLAILESYSHDRQIIIATHSPQIVDWCKPEDLRLVERIEGQTRVRKLDENELGRVHNYLTHDGTLSDYVYRQSIE